MPLPDQRQVEMEVATRDGAGGAAADGGGRAGKRRAATSVVDQHGGDAGERVQAFVV